MAIYTKDDLPVWPRLPQKIFGEDPVIAMTQGDIAVGKIAFFYDENRRVYVQSTDAEGVKRTSPVIERYHYVPVLIVDETRVSWIGQHGDKFKKATGVLYGLVEVENLLIVHQRGALSRAVQVCDDASKLRQVAEIMGFELDA